MGNTRYFIIATILVLAMYFMKYILNFPPDKIYMAIIIISQILTLKELISINEKIK